MKELRLKMQELTNPTILTSHEIKNIMGGSTLTVSGSINVDCALHFSDGQSIYQQCQSQAQMQSWIDACHDDYTCIQIRCWDI
jgi:hypothetical protein